MRDGLRFTDGTAVTARDCVASIRRWAARDGGGQHMMARLADTPVKDDKTFQLVMKEPYSLAVDWLAKAATNVCYVMREKEAQTDPNQQITTILGSGPFTFNQDAVVQGQRYVYDRNRELCAALGAGGLHLRRQGRERRPRHLREHRR